MPADIPLIYGCPSLLDRLMDHANRVALPVPQEISTRHFPPLQVFEDENALYVRAALSGLTEENIHLSLDGNTLVLRGVVPLLPGRHLRRERPVGPFRRDIHLPFRIDADGIRAVLSNGLLAVTLPKSESGKKRSIPVAIAAGEQP